MIYYIYTQINYNYLIYYLYANIIYLYNYLIRI